MILFTLRSTAEQTFERRKSIERRASHPTPHLMYEVRSAFWKKCTQLLPTTKQGIKIRWVRTLKIYIRLSLAFTEPRKSHRGNRSNGGDPSFYLTSFKIDLTTLRIFSPLLFVLSGQFPFYSQCDFRYFCKKVSGETHFHDVYTLDYRQGLSDTLRFPNVGILTSFGLAPGKVSVIAL